MKFELRIDLTPEHQGTYLTQPFTVPEGYAKLTLSYRFDRNHSVIDLGLMDAHGTFLGWSGSAHDQIFVGATDSSPGYLRTAIMPGEWSILIGAYKVGPSGCTVPYTIELEPQAPQWYVGDLHMHSTASDGTLPSYALGERARALGLDFIAVTDHNNFSENAHLPHVPGVTYIPGVEWTHYKGHMNFFGVANPFQGSFVANSHADMTQLIQHARSLGALISVNHPCDEGVPYEWDDIEAFDAVEVWNGPMRPANLRAIAWWASLIQNGRRVPLLAGSDFHRPKHIARLGHPVTWLYAPSAAPQDLLDAMRAGHASLSSAIDGPQIELSCGDAIMGDQIHWSDALQFSYRVERHRRRDKIILVTDQGEKYLTASQGTLSLPSQVQYAYIKITRTFGSLNLVRAISNPIYFKHADETL